MLSPTKAIREKCLDCCCGQSLEVKLCPAESCPLYPYRFGRNPNVKKRNVSEETKLAMRERMAKINAAKYGTMDDQD